MRRRTCTYSTTESSPKSLFAVNLVAGKALGVTFKSTRLRELVTVSAEMETAQRGQCGFRRRWRRDYAQRFWSRRNRGSPSPWRLLTLPMCGEAAGGAPARGSQLGIGQAAQRVTAGLRS